MLQARAEVQTQRAERYRKQLASHLGRNCAVSENPDGDGSWIALPPERGTGRCLLIPQDGKLDLLAEAANAEDLARIQDVIGRHLERFGERDGFTVTWTDSNR